VGIVHFVGETRVDGAKGDNADDAEDDDDGALLYVMNAIIREGEVRT